jgi:hypothetical protein
LVLSVHREQSNPCCPPSNFCAHVFIHVCDAA